MAGGRQVVCIVEDCPSEDALYCVRGLQRHLDQYHGLPSKIAELLAVCVANWPLRGFALNMTCERRREKYWWLDRPDNLKTE